MKHFTHQNLRKIGIYIGTLITGIQTFLSFQSDGKAFVFKIITCLLFLFFVIVLIIMWGAEKKAQRSKIKIIDAIIKLLFDSDYTFSAVSILYNYESSKHFTKGNFKDLPENWKEKMIAIFQDEGQKLKKLRFKNKEAAYESAIDMFNKTEVQECINYFWLLLKPLNNFINFRDEYKKLHDLSLSVKEENKFLSRSAILNG